MSSTSDVQKKFPLPSAWEEDLEQALAMVWSQLEAGHRARPELEKVIDAEIRVGKIGRASCRERV